MELGLELSLAHFFHYLQLSLSSRTLSLSLPHSYQDSRCMSRPPSIENSLKDVFHDIALSLDVPEAHYAENLEHVLRATPDPHSVRLPLLPALTPSSLDIAF